MMQINQRFIFLLIMVFIFTGNAVANAQVPCLAMIQEPLLIKSWSRYGLALWEQAGEVGICNDSDTLYIDIKANEDYLIAKLNINLSEDDYEAFVPILNKKGKPIPEKFNFSPPLDDFAPEFLFAANLYDDICWGVPQACADEIFIIVHAELVRYDDTTGQYENIGKAAFAFGDGDFDRVIRGENEEEGLDWGYYILYPIAK